jgi:hypothetical protein
MTERLNHKLDTSKLKTIKDIKNVFDTMGLIASMDEDNEQYEVAKEYFTIPYNHPEIKGSFQLPRKSLEEISQEFDEKIDKQIEDVEYKFAQLKYYQEHCYNQKFNKIIENFESAKKYGSFPVTLTIGNLNCSNLIATGSNITPSFVIKSGGKEVGYYTFGNGYLKYYMDKKPSAIVRFFMKVCLGFMWVEDK